MELRRLEVFLAIADAGTLTAAGRQVHLVQSAVSANLRVLEDEFGVRLFNRTARRAVLTDAGVALVPHARAVVAAARAARDAVTESRTELRGPLVVGTMTTTHLVDLPHLLGAFQSTHPHVTISLRLHPDGSRGLIEGVLAGDLDLAFVSMSGPVTAKLRLRTLARVPMRLVLPRGHSAADSRRITLADVAADRWIDSPAGFGNRAVVDAAFARADLTRLVSLEVADVPSMPEYVEAGLGIAAVPAFVPLDPDRVLARKIADADLMWPILLATARRTPERAVVRAFVRAVAQDPAGAATEAGAAATDVRWS